MGKRGPKSAAPGGYGTVSPKGYRRVWCATEKRLRMEHDLVWERHNGPVPIGMHVHHVNEDKLDNRIENLALLDPTMHKRSHSGCELIGGVWWKRCGDCDVKKPIDRENWYHTSQGWPAYGWCRPCHIKRVVRSKQERRAAMQEKGKG